MVFDRDGNLVVTDEGAEAIYRVDVTTGAAAAGGQLAARGSTRRALVADTRAALIRINAETAPRCSSPAARRWSSPPASPNARRGAGRLRPQRSQRRRRWRHLPRRRRHRRRDADRFGRASRRSLGVYATADGHVVIADGAPAAGRERSCCLDLATGAVTTIATSPDFVEPSDVYLLGNQLILVADPDAAAGAGALFQADPTTGAVSTVASGAPFVDPTSVLAEPPTCGALWRRSSARRTTSSELGRIVRGRHRRRLRQRTGQAVHHLRRRRQGPHQRQQGRRPALRRCRQGPDQRRPGPGQDRRRPRPRPLQRQGLQGHGDGLRAHPPHSLARGAQTAG